MRIKLKCGCRIKGVGSPVDYSYVIVFPCDFHLFKPLPFPVVNEKLVSYNRHKFTQKFYLIRDFGKEI